jgi:allantoin racemase
VSLRILLANADTTAAVTERCAAAARTAAADPAAVAVKVTEAARDLLCGGADAMILGGAALAGMGERIQAEVPVPLVDGIAAAVRLAEALAPLGLKKPAAGSYAAPKGRASVGLAVPLAALLGG